MVRERLTLRQDCGEEMYWDIKGLSIERAKTLSQRLNHPTGTVSNPQAPASNPGTSEIIMPPAAHAPSQVLDYRIRYMPISRSPSSQSIYNSQEQIHAQAIRNPRFIELCINNGIYSKALGEVDISNANSDAGTFDRIANMYYEKRNKRGVILAKLPNMFGNTLAKYRLQLRFQKPASITFRKVRCYDIMSPGIDGANQSVYQFLLDKDSVVLDRPGIPPETEVSSHRYEYRPCPFEPDELPMPDHQFFHLFYKPAGHQRSIWTQRLPKKLKESIFSSSDELPIGWGIHITEAPDFYVISAFTLTGLVVSGILAIVWATVTKDVQGAFGMGSYIAAIQAAWMATMYFKWSRE